MGLAARGARQLGEDVEQIDDLAELGQVRGQAAVVRRKSAVTGAMVTVLTLLI